MIYKHMDYIPFDIHNPNCLHVMLSNRAYCSIINETFEHGTDETGGLLLGYIVGRRWYVVEVIDPGTNNTIHQTGLFMWDQDHVNAMASRMRNLYRIQPTILGFWHRHPGSMDYFSQQDVESTQKNLQGASKGLISMLVNIDPVLRMSFYYCNGPHFMPVRYDVGDEYFPVELLEYATPEVISQRHVNNQRGRAVHISYRRILQPPAAPGTVPKKSVRADNDVSPEENVRPVTSPAAASVQKPAARTQPEAVSGSEPATEPQPVVVPDPEPAAEPQPVNVPDPEPATEPQPVVVPDPEPAAEPQPVVVPDPEPAAEPQPVVVPDPEPAAEPQPVTVPDSEPEAAAEPQPESVAEASEDHSVSSGQEPAPETNEAVQNAEGVKKNEQCPGTSD